MKSVGRWSFATVVTIAAFTLVTWLCGALVLPHMLADPAVRWGISGCLGVAVAALAALWGHSFAAGGQHAESADNSGPAAATQTRRTLSADTHNEISGGTFHGSVIQVRNISGAVPRSPAQEFPELPD
jgi:hypothetical protein